MKGVQRRMEWAGMKVNLSHKADNKYEESFGNYYLLAKD